MFERYYTYAPEDCVTYLGIRINQSWPWILRNIKQQPQRTAEHEIVDIGIYDLLHIPFCHSEEKINKWKELKTEGWKVVPDCPDINGEFRSTIFNNLMKLKKKVSNKYGELSVHIQRFIGYWWDYLPTFDTVSYSWNLLTELFDPTDEHHLPVIQCKYQNFKSYKQYIKRFKDKYGEHDKIAVGSICKADDNVLAVKMLKYLKQCFRTSWIHAFGLRMTQFRNAYQYIDSFDSMSFKFPRSGGRPSCRYNWECLQYFWEYIAILVMYMSFENDVVQTKLGVIV
jgi:hypothetical protein